MYIEKNLKIGGGMIVEESLKQKLRQSFGYYMENLMAQYFFEKNIVTLSYKHGRNNYGKNFEILLRDFERKFQKTDLYRDHDYIDTSRLTLTEHLVKSNAIEMIRWENGEAIVSDVKSKFDQHDKSERNRLYCTKRQLEKFIDLHDANINVTIIVPVALDTPRFIEIPFDKFEIPDLENKREDRVRINIPIDYRNQSEYVKIPSHLTPWNNLDNLLELVDRLYKKGIINVVENEMAQNCIPASSIADQFWCEMKLDLTRKFGSPDSQGKRIGRDIHKNLFQDACSSTPVKIKTSADRLHLDLSNISAGSDLIINEGMARELPIYFKFGSFFINGVADEVRLTMEEGRDSINRKRKFKRTKLIETKTRIQNRQPTNPQIFRDKIQCMVYWYGLNSMINKNIDIEELFSYKDIDKNTVSLSDNYLNSIKTIITNAHYFAHINPKIKSHMYMNDIDSGFRKIAKLPKLSEGIILRYIHQDTREEIYMEDFKFDSDFFQEKIEWALDYWLGNRKPIPEEEKYRWKCNYCTFKNVKCPVYLKS
jgi:exonuclease V